MVPDVTPCPSVPKFGRKQPDTPDLLIAADIVRERRKLRAFTDNPNYGEHTSNGQLANAAAMLALGKLWFVNLTERGLWLWPCKTFPEYRSRREDLVRAAAFLLAEVERLDKLAADGAKRNV